jgi:hypothetical protein
MIAGIIEVLNKAATATVFAVAIRIAVAVIAPTSNVLAKHLSKK